MIFRLIQLDGFWIRKTANYITLPADALDNGTLLLLRSVLTLLADARLWTASIVRFSDFSDCSDCSDCLPSPFFPVVSALLPYYRVLFVSHSYNYWLQNLSCRNRSRLFETSANLTVLSELQLIRWPLQMDILSAFRTHLSFEIYRRRWTEITVNSTGSLEFTFTWIRFIH